MVREDTTLLSNVLYSYPEPKRKNGTINIDQGCVFGGKLTAYRYPEDELVSVPAKRNYSGLTDTPLTRFKADD